MGFSAPFIARPIATILLSMALLLSGLVAYRFLPASAMPSIDIPTIVVFAGRPGADPETMANSVAAPLELKKVKFTPAMALPFWSVATA